MEPAAEIVLLSGFVADLASATCQPDVLQVTAKWLPEMIEAERSSIALPIDAQNLVLHAAGGALVLGTDVRLPIKKTLVGQAFVSQEIVNVADLGQLELEAESRLVEAGLRSALIAPMVSAGRCLGTINLANSRKNFFDGGHETLLRSIADLIASFLGVHQLVERQAKRASVDVLTGAMSRSAILETLDQAFEDGDERPSLLYLDANGFKTINDTHGHRVGDGFLTEIVKRIASLSRDDDALGRLGGDEFLVVVQRDRTGRIARELAERIAECFLKPVAVQGLMIAGELSIGVASVESLDSTATDLLHEADQMMYTAKVEGEPIAVANSTTRRQLAVRSAVDHELDEAMTEGMLAFHYQPVCDIDTFEVMGAEALLRWKHPKHDWIPAPILIERIESTGRTEAFTKWSLAEVIRSWTVLRSQLPWFHDKAVSLNLTPRQLSWDGLTEFFLLSLADAGFRPQDVIVEVVESAEILPGTAAEQTLQRLGQAGVVIALDDFGTGHNALGYFTQFPIHAIKFDRSLVGAMAQHDPARRILKGLALMAADLGVVALAEGIETETELLLCREAMISHGQGWHLGYPVPIEDLIETIKASTALGRGAYVPQSAPNH